MTINGKHKRQKANIIQKNIISNTYQVTLRIKQ